MKALTLGTASIVIVALCIGLGFHWAYPRVTLSAELLGLFVFVAAVLTLIISKAWSVLSEARRSPKAGEKK